MPLPLKSVLRHVTDLTDPAAVNAAMNEFDCIGRDNFLRSMVLVRGRFQWGENSVRA